MGTAIGMLLALALILGVVYASAIHIAELLVEKRLVEYENGEPLNRDDPSSNDLPLRWTDVLRTRARELPVWLHIVLIVAELSIASGILIFTGAQVSVSSDELRAIGEQNDTLINQTREMVRQGDTLIRQSGEMARQNEFFEQQLSQSAEAINEMRLERRAWIGITNLSIVKCLPEEPVEYQYFLHNSGRTPGRITAYRRTIVAVPKGGDLSGRFDELLAFPVASTTVSGIVVPPDSSIRLPHTGVIITQDTIDQIKAGDAELYAIGRFTYENGLEGRLGETQYRLLFKLASDENEKGELVFHQQDNDMK